MDAQENRIFTAILITAVVLGTVIIYFIISILRQQRLNLKLHKQAIRAEVEQIEKERARIANDLHDDLSPLLAAVKMKISSFDLADEEDKIQLEKTNENLDDVMSRIRSISFNLMPASLLRKGIIQAVNEFVKYLNTNSSIQFHFKGDKNIKVAENIAVNLYRITQELAHNTIKHSGATECRLELKVDKKIVLLTMNDNGVGFDYEKESSENMGFGLKSLLRRTEIMNGKMYIETTKGVGTNYTFEIPL